MAPAKEDFEAIESYIQNHFGQWLAQYALRHPAASYE
jgi:hypothetical protein